MAAAKKKPGFAVRGPSALAMPPFDPRRETVDDFDLRVRQHLTQQPAAQHGNGAVAEKRHRNLLLQHLPPPVKAGLQAALRPRQPSLAPVAALLAALRRVRTECLAEASRAKGARGAKGACKPGSTPHTKARLRLQRLLQAPGCTVAGYVQQLDQLLPQCGYAEDIGEAVAKDRLVIGLLQRGMRCRLLELLDRGASFQELRAFALKLDQTGDLPEGRPMGGGAPNQMGLHGGSDPRNGMGHRMGSRMGSPVDNHIMRNQNMDNSMRPPMENRMRPLLEAPIENSMGPPMGNRMRPLLEYPVENYMEPPMGNRMRPLLEYPVENYMEPPMGNRMRPLSENPMENPGPNMRNPMGEHRGGQNQMGDGAVGQHALWRGAGVLRGQQNAAWGGDGICLDDGDFRQFDGNRGGAWGGRGDGGDDWKQGGAGWGGEEGRDEEQYQYQEECARCGLVAAGSRCPRCEQWPRGPATGGS